MRAIDWAIIKNDKIYWLEDDKSHTHFHHVNYKVCVLLMFWRFKLNARIASNNTWLQWDCLIFREQHRWNHRWLIFMHVHLNRIKEKAKDLKLEFIDVDRSSFLRSRCNQRWASQNRACAILIFSITFSRFSY